MPTRVWIGTKTVLHTASASHAHTPAMTANASWRRDSGSGPASAGAPPDERAALARFGDALGMIFQIVDDLLDYTADAATTGNDPNTFSTDGTEPYRASHVWASRTFSPRLTLTTLAPWSTAQRMPASTSGLTRKATGASRPSPVATADSISASSIDSSRRRRYQSNPITSTTDAIESASTTTGVSVPVA